MPLVSPRAEITPIDLAPSELVQEFNGLLLLTEIKNLLLSN